MSTAAVPAGACPQCGGQLYAGLTHACNTSVLHPVWFASPPQYGPVEATQRQALKLLLGGGLDEAGKDAWIDGRLAEGQKMEALFVAALRLMDGQIAT